MTIYPPAPFTRAPAATATPTRPALSPRTRTTGHRTVVGSDEGTLMLYMVPVVIVLLMFAGLVFDGGTALAARGRAADLAGQAARAGADALGLESLRTPGQVDLGIDPDAARTAGQRILTEAGATGTITLQGTDVVTVTARVPAHTAILSAIGIDDATGTATASATILHGISTPRVAP
jgi:hypothetical protein